MSWLLSSCSSLSGIVWKDKDLERFFFLPQEANDQGDGDPSVQALPPLFFIVHKKNWRDPLHWKTKYSLHVRILMGEKLQFSSLDRCSDFSDFPAHHHKNNEYRLTKFSPRFLVQASFHCHPAREQYRRQLAADVGFLAQYNMMDYSLLVGVGPPPEDAPINSLSLRFRVVFCAEAYSPMTGFPDDECWEVVAEKDSSMCEQRLFSVPFSGHFPSRRSVDAMSVPEECHHNRFLKVARGEFSCLFFGEPRGWQQKANFEIRAPLFQRIVCSIYELHANFYLV